ncbi:MAG: DUF4446 family protein [Parcubacteria group bacterium]|nr:DUF4446 family protein [Parcubacteria group bacterium]
MITLDPTTLLILLGGTMIFALIAFFWALRLEIRIHKLLGDTEACSLEKAVLELHEKTGQLATTQEKINAYLSEAEKRIQGSVHGVATIRFNPFQGQGAGSNQSFATALLNEHGDGVVFSSIYSRDRVSIFAKPIVKKESEYELSSEEKQAIREATKQYTEKK